MKRTLTTKKILSECPQDWKRPTFWNEVEIYAWWLRRKLASCYWWSCDFAAEGIRTLKSGILCCGICKLWPRFLKGRLALIQHENDVIIIESRSKDTTLFCKLAWNLAYKSWVITLNHLSRNRALGFGIRNTAQRIQNPTNMFHWQRIQNPGPGIGARICLYVKEEIWKTRLGPVHMNQGRLNSKTARLTEHFAFRTFC